MMNSNKPMAETEGGIAEFVVDKAVPPMLRAQFIIVAYVVYPSYMYTRPTDEPFVHFALFCELLSTSLMMTP